MNLRRAFVSKANWWSVLVPDEWQVAEDADCVTLHSGFGTVQISAARNDLGDVKAEDLREVARDRESKGCHLIDVEYSAFRGISTEYENDGRYWIEWWLRSGDLVLYVTLIVGLEQKTTARKEVESILDSLRQAL